MRIITLDKDYVLEEVGHPFITLTFRILCNGEYEGYVYNPYQLSHLAKQLPEELKQKIKFLLGG